MSSKLSAFNENREFFFTLDKKTETSVTITMYGTEYTLIKKGDSWENHEKNKNKMSAGLIAGVIRTLGLSDH